MQHIMWHRVCAFEFSDLVCCSWFVVSPAFVRFWLIFLLILFYLFLLRLHFALAFPLFILLMILCCFALMYELCLCALCLCLLFTLSCFSALLSFCLLCGLCFYLRLCCICTFCIHVLMHVLFHFTCFPVWVFHVYCLLSFSITYVHIVLQL